MCSSFRVVNRLCTRIGVVLGVGSYTVLDAGLFRVGVVLAVYIFMYAVSCKTHRKLSNKKSKARYEPLPKTIDHIACVT
jgi:hypothetical protein